MPAQNLSRSLPVLAFLLVALQEIAYAQQPNPGPPDHPSFSGIMHYPDGTIEKYYVTTAPEKFTLGKDHYSIPGNYYLKRFALGYMAVTYPGFKPFSDDTRDCLVPQKRVGQFPDCFRIEFDLRTGTAPQAEIVFERMRHLFPTNVPERGPDHLEKYHIGPMEGGDDIYREVEGGKTSILIQCIVYPGFEWPEGACRDTFDFRDGVMIIFRIPESQIGHGPEIQHGLEALMKTFIVE